jgi:hypothetical protein
MSFGVVIGTAKGLPLIEISGPAYGIPSSHRAECTGCLAGALILHHLAIFTGIPFPPSLPTVTISDNLGMITSLTARRAYTIPYPNATLQTDWDLLEEIHQTYQMSKLTEHSYEWVQGHQDSRIPSAERTSMSQQAKYNIRADTLAGAFSLDIDHSLRTHTPNMRFTKCTLQLQNISQHGQYSRAIRRTVAEPELYKYLTRKHDWDETTHQEIDWLAFRMAARNHRSSNEIQLLKIVHDHLPTRAHLAKFQSWTDPQCHHCLYPDTMDHLQRSDCNNCSSTFRVSLKDSITAYFDRHQTPLRFQSIFLEALNAWLLQDKDEPTTSTWTKQQHPVKDSQNAIGLRLITRGFLSTQWRRLLLTTLHQEQWIVLDTEWDADEDDSVFPTADEVLTDTDTEASTAARILVDTDSEDDESTPSPTCLVYNESRSIDPTLFLAGLIKCIWSEVNHLWTNHQKALHDTEANISNPQRHDLKQRIRALHDLRRNTRNIHQDTYFFHDLETFLEKGSLYQFQNYIDKYTPAILDSIVQAGGPINIPYPHNITPEAISNQTDHNQHPALEEAPHRKRNRRRTPVRTLNPITNYFGPRYP